MAVTHLGHVAIRCSNLDDSLAFYAKLGLREAFRLTRPDGSVNLVYLQIDDTSFLELFPGGTEKIPGGRGQIGYVHCCLLVDDLQTSYRDAVAQGGDGNWQFWVTDPDGTRIEMMQIMPESMQARAAQQLAATR